MDTSGRKEGEAIRTDCQARKTTGHPKDWERNFQRKDSVKDCREHGSSGMDRNDLRGQHLLSPFLCAPHARHNRKWNQPERSCLHPAIYHH